MNVMDAVGQALPKRAWLETLELNVAEKPQVTLNGSTISNDDVSDFVDKLTESIHLSDVVLENMSAKQHENADARTFQITAVPKGSGTSLENAQLAAPMMPNPPARQMSSAPQAGGGR